MTTGIWARYYGLATFGFGTAAVAIYLPMINITLAHLEAVSTLTPFDIRPLGYSPQEAAALLGALGEEGRMYYLTRQIPLDTVYPALLALTLVFAVYWFRRDLPESKLARVGPWASVGAAILDYAENLGVAAMILSWPNLPDHLVHATSAATVAKSGTTTVAVLLVLLTGANWVARTREGLQYQFCKFRL
ncbi:MAG: hypothetical protein AB8B60_19540 [Sulfitobacter sp.]